jgi:flagellar basal body rod protein FlgG
LTREYQNIAHNLANVNTTGFKRKVSAFSRELDISLNEDVLLNLVNDDVSPISGKIQLDESLDFSPGSFLGTDRPLDTAISGKGFFVIETPDGPLYTRNGVFQINLNGQLVDLEGRIVAGANGPIIIPEGVGESQINIANDGEISADGNMLGKLRIVEFGEDEEKLMMAGMNCLMAPEGVVATNAENAMVRQGFRENSNVKRMDEVVNLITVSRLYEMNMGLLKRRSENAKAIIGVANS